MPRPQRRQAVRCSSCKDGRVACGSARAPDIVRQGGQDRSALRNRAHVRDDGERHGLGGGRPKLESPHKQVTKIQGAPGLSPAFRRRILRTARTPTRFSPRSPGLLIVGRPRPGSCAPPASSPTPLRISRPPRSFGEIVRRSPAFSVCRGPRKITSRLQRRSATCCSVCQAIRRRSPTS